MSVAAATRRLIASCSLVVLLPILTACAGGAREFAQDSGMAEQLVRGTDYEHVVFRQTGSGDGRLHIYIEGDGRPWINGRVPARDPTPVNPLALRLMALDKAIAAYIGRPCYFGRAGDPGCGPEAWTAGRYSAETAASMAAAANRVIASGAYREVVLIGYSGGGVIALQMAPSVSRVRGILTVAANLDTRAWTDHHNYLPLDRSQNPALLGETPPAGIVHVQACGGRDENVPASVIASYASHKKGLEVWEYPDYDHVCCWQKEWPALLERFDARLSRDAAGAPGPDSGGP